MIRRASHTPPRSRSTLDRGSRKAWSFTSEAGTPLLVYSSERSQDTVYKYYKYPKGRDSCSRDTKERNSSMQTITLYFVLTMALFVVLWLVSECVNWTKRLYRHRNGLDEGSPSSAGTIQMDLIAQLSGKVVVSNSNDTDCVSLVGDFGGCQKILLPANHSCAICLNAFHLDEALQKNVSCNHIFHADCLTTWLKRGQFTCPTCRAAFALQDASPSV